MIDLIDRDLRHIWHPCTQMKDFEKCPPLVIEKAQGSYLYTDKGPLIDAISSWWCKSLGHGHPAVIQAMQDQLLQFEHVIAANTTHPKMVELGEKLTKISNKQHVFFASDGSSAVEIALKLTLHAHQIQGHPHKTEIISLKHSYHGETLGTLSVSDLGIYKKPYDNYGLTCHFLDNLPYVSGEDDPLWHNAESHWLNTLEHLERIKTNVAAILVEPIAQGAGGMRIYSAYFLKKLSEWAKENQIYFIADEIMTGIGRTGEWLACDHANVEPDIVCLAKGLTSGAMPLSCVLIDNAIYSLFYDDYSEGKSFLHSHTHSGNALAIAAALATLKVIESENVILQSKQLGEWMKREFIQVAQATGKIENIRSIGALVAGDLVPSPHPRVGYAFYQEALKHGAYTRPIGNTLYWLPPLNTDEKTIVKLAEITLHSINQIYSSK